MTAIQNTITVAGKILLCLVLSIITWQYFYVEFYQFSSPRGFEGDFWYNPYQDYNGEWHKANFHAHAHAWGGLTNGHQDGLTVQQHYERHGYTIAPITDYFSINAQQDKSKACYIPAYEHGTDIHKSHRQLIGTEQVLYADLIFSGHLSLKQYLINRAKRMAPVVVINHPFLKHEAGHPRSYFKHLSGYDLMEISNAGRLSTAHWDVALSAGKPVWALGNDDCHDLNEPAFGTAWTYVGAYHLDQSSIIQALKQGRTVVMQRNNLQKEGMPYNLNPDFAVKQVRISHDTLKITLSGMPGRIDFVGHGGKTLKKIENAQEGWYVLQSNDRYIRIEVISEHNHAFLNPVVRTPDPSIPINHFSGSIHLLTTILFRVALLLLDFVTCYLLFLYRPASRLRRRPQPAMR